jgi:hypothetical protein
LFCRFAFHTYYFSELSVKRQITNVV